MEENIFAVWFAGLFEGEGTFNIVKEKAKKISLTSTDLDVLERIKRMVGGSICATATKKEHWKQAYVWSVSGEVARAWVVKIYPYLLSRRKDRANDWLEIFDNNNVRQKNKVQGIKDKKNKVIALSKTGITHAAIAQVTGYERSSVTKILNNI